MLQVDVSPFRKRLQPLPTAPKKKYGCLMAILPESFSRLIVDWCKANIDPKHLMKDGWSDQPHVTIKYGFVDDLSKDIEDAVSMFQPFTIRLLTPSLFKGNEDGDVLKLDVTSGLLFDINRYVSKAFTCEDKYPVYRPHLTLAYLDPQFSASYTAIKPPFLNTVIRITQLQYSTAEKKRINIDLEKNRKALSWLSSGAGADLVKPAKFPKTLVPKSPFRAKSLEWDIKAGFTGQKTDKRGRKICYSDGKRVACNKPAEGGGKKPPSKKPEPKPKKEKITPQNAIQRISEMLKAGKVSQQDATELATFLNGLTVVQLNALKTELKLNAKGKKAELAKQIAEQALNQAKAGGTPDDPKKKPEDKEGNAGPLPPSNKFTGVDSLGRKWVNGKLTGEQEEAKEIAPSKSTLQYPKSIKDALASYDREIFDPVDFPEVALRNLASVMSNRESFGLAFLKKENIPEPIFQQLVNLSMINEFKSSDGTTSYMVDKSTATAALLMKLGLTYDDLNSFDLGNVRTRKDAKILGLVFSSLNKEVQESLVKEYGIDGTSKLLGGKSVRKLVERKLLVEANRDIGIRVRANKEVQAKVAEISRAGSVMDEVETEISNLQKETAKFDKVIQKLRWNDNRRVVGTAKEKKAWKEEMAKYEAERQKIYDKLTPLYEKRSESEKMIAEHVKGLITLKDSKPASVGIKSAGKIAPDVRKAVDNGVKWLSGVVARGQKGEDLPEYKAAFKDERAYYDNEEHFINVGDDDNPGVMIHEMGHGIEYKLPGASAAAFAFLEYRAAGEEVVQYNEMPWGKGYANNERGRRDNFNLAFETSSAYYVGKSYPGSTEIISMGVQKLYEDPVKFASKDPEYCAFIVGVLNGSLRGRDIPNE